MFRSHTFSLTDPNPIMQSSCPFKNICVVHDDDDGGDAIDVAASAADVATSSTSSSRRTRVDNPGSSTANDKGAANGSPAAAPGRGSAIYPARSAFGQTPTNITVSPGDRAVLKCRVENLGTKTVRRRNSHRSSSIIIIIIIHRQS